MNLFLENLGKLQLSRANMGNPQKVFDWNKAAKLIDIEAENETKELSEGEN